MITQLLRSAYWLAPLGQPPTLLGAVAYLFFLSLNLATLMLLLYRIIKYRQFRLLYGGLALTSFASCLAVANRFMLLVPSARWQVGLPAVLTGIQLVWLYLQRELAALLDHWSSFLNWRLPTLHLSTGVSLVLMGISLLVLAVLTRLYNWPFRLLLLFAIIMSSPQLLPAVRRRHSLMAAFSLLPLSLVASAEILSRLVWHANLLSAPLPAVLAGICLAATWIYPVTTLYPRQMKDILAWSATGLGASALLAWLGWTLYTLTARGVSGSDPYGYIQMALDWARTGTFLHPYPLATAMRELGLNPEAALHIGYRLPLFTNNLAATVWPTGHAWLLGMFGRLFGDAGVYWGTPLLAVCAVLSTAGLAYVLAPVESRLYKAVAAVLSAVMMATSFEFLSWTLVHMADISAILFTVLCFGAAWLSRSKTGWRSLLLAGLSGIVLGMAYWVRHTQVVMVVPLALLLLAPKAQKDHAVRIANLVTLGTCALLTALPDLLYHLRLFGSFFTPESKELMHYSLTAIPRTAWLVIRQWSAQREFLLLLLWLVIGAVITWKRRRLAGITLLAWLLALWVIQVPYAPLRLRDLLPVLPVLVYFTIIGVMESVRWLSRQRVWAAWLLVLLIAGMFTLRSAKVLYLAQTYGFNNFGYLWASQRAEFERLDAELPTNALVGAGLHSGAVELYGRRLSFQVSLWSREELESFIADQTQRGVSVYLLDDSTSSSAAINALRGTAELQPVLVMHAVPYYFPGGGSDNLDITLYRVKAP